MKANLKIISNSVGSTLAIGRKISQNLSKADIICLFGELGSGKTQLVKGIAAGLGASKNEVNSPSFVLLKQYKGKLALNHFDLYRLKRVEEILDLGFDEYIYSDCVNIIEWAERLKGCLPKEFLKVELSITGENRRELNFSAPTGRYRKLLKALKAFKLK